MSKTSRRQFLIGTALASVAALTATHRQTHLLVDKSLTDEAWERIRQADQEGPVFQVLMTGPLMVEETDLFINGPDGLRMYRTGETITQERVVDMTSEDSGPVLYDERTKAMQRLHEVRDLMGWRNNPPSEPELGLTRRLTPALGRRRGGHWS